MQPLPKASASRGKEAYKALSLRGRVTLDLFGIGVNNTSSSEMQTVRLAGSIIFQATHARLDSGSPHLASLSANMALYLYE